MKTIPALVVSLAFTALAPAGQAQLASISPFPGQSTESFESFPPSYTSSPLSVMGGAASVQSSGSVSIYDPLSWIFSLGSSSENVPSHCALGANGPRGLGLEDNSVQAQATITFAHPVNAFGGFWGAGTSETNPATISMTFHDAANHVIGFPQTFTYRRPSGDGMLEWHGWSSDVPVAKVTLVVDGPTAVADDLRISLAPHFSSISWANSGKVKLIGHGVAGQTYTVQAKPSLNTINWISLGTATADSAGMLQFEDVSAPGLVNRFYRLSAP